MGYCFNAIIRASQSLRRAVENAVIVSRKGEKRMGEFINARSSHGCEVTNTGGGGATQVTSKSTKVHSLVKLYKHGRHRKMGHLQVL